MQFFDSHLHLQDPRLAPHLDEIFDQCLQHKILYLAINGTHPDDWHTLSQLQSQAPSPLTILPQYGIHPWKSAHLPGNWHSQLQTMLENNPYAGIGEIGLDNWINQPPLSQQQPLFLSQLKLAHRYNRPASIHVLKAWQPSLQILKTNPLPERGILLHSFNGDWGIAQQLLPLNAHFSFSPYMLQPKKQHVRDAFARIPLERIHLESDAPDQLAPNNIIPHPIHPPYSHTSLRAQKKSTSPTATPLNSPSVLPQLAVQLARIRQQPPEEIIPQLLQNSLTLFCP